MPSESTIFNINKEMGIISQLHIEEELKDKNQLTIHRDATTKQGHHYYGVKLSTDEKELTIGLKEISRGTAKKYIDATNKLLKPIQSEIPITAKISNSITRQKCHRDKNKSFTDRYQENSFTGFYGY